MTAAHPYQPAVQVSFGFYTREPDNQRLFHTLLFHCATNLPLPRRKQPITPVAVLHLSNAFMQSRHPTPGGFKSGIEMAHDAFDALYALGMKPILQDSDGFRLRCWMRQEEVDAPCVASPSQSDPGEAA